MDTLTPDPTQGGGLRATLATLEGKVFAVVDGGHFDDLPVECRRIRLFARSLFLDHADKEAEKSGPWLITLDQEKRATDKVLSLVGEKPAIVIWVCDDGEATLHHHLRTLNMVRIPDWAARGELEPPDRRARTVFETVMFRHWDPRVLGAFLPILDDDQFARILGPASRIVYHTEDHGGLKQVIDNGALPDPPHGPLTVRADQIEWLGARRDRARYRRMASFLRTAAPEQTAGLDDSEVHALVVRYEASGERAGLTNERSQSLWCYLMLASNERFEQLPKVRRYLRTGPGSPDENLVQIFHHVGRLAATDRGVG